MMIWYNALFLNTEHCKSHNLGTRCVSAQFRISCLTKNTYIFSYVLWDDLLDNLLCPVISLEATDPSSEICERVYAYMNSWIFTGSIEVNIAVPWRQKNMCLSLWRSQRTGSWCFCEVIINKITFTTSIFQSHPVFEIQGDKVFNNMALARVRLNLQLCWKCLLGILQCQLWNSFLLQQTMLTLNHLSVHFLEIRFHGSRPMESRFSGCVPTKASACNIT